ncbi:MAG: AAA family ATPase [Planctomycetes bacterium]|nr:AAA family ATPase [Planctomycetota bacterium]
MTALDSIIAWAKRDLPEWQSDAVRRLLVQDTLTDNDRQDLLFMVRALHGLLPDGTTSPTPRPLQKGMVSGSPKSRVNVVLKAMKGLQSINKIPDGSSLPFGHQGLTVIYGENGAGKSGYARVLKRACRARDTQERILPNVYGTTVAVPARATFKLSVNGGPEQEVEWEDGKASDDILTNITVFDARCARVILDEKNEVTYLPYGAHVFEALVSVLNWIRQQIEAEKPKPEPLQWPDITLATKPGIFLAGFTHDTNEKEVEDAAAWADDDADKLEELTKQLAQLEANDPIKQAAKLRSFKERVTNLKKHIEQRAAALADERLGKLKQMLDALAEAKKSVELASQATLQEEPLRGAGESAWQILYDAAKDYSTKHAYPDDEFPVVGDESHCVFCMQPLSEDAKQRLLRFKAFMEQAAKKKHEDAKKALDSAVESFEALNNKAAADQNGNTIDELMQRDEKVATAAESCLTAIHSRLEYFDQLISGRETGEIPPLPNSPAKALTKIIVALEKEAEGLEKAVDPTERDKLKNEKAEFLARKCFADNRAKILAYLADLKTAHKCDQALASTDTAAITRKGKSVVSEALTPQLRDAVQSELELLGADHLPLSLRPSGRRGETLHQLELKGATSGRKVSLTDVLSEGEQRVVALAGFFAEVGLGQHSCPVVLDDPVSSLDHRYRSTIAARLVSESRKRQVLVFTHDIAFLLDLQEKAGELDGVHFTAQTVLQQNEAAGVPNEGLPWHAMLVRRRLEYLRNTLKEIKVLCGTGQAEYDKKAAFLYALLRETWEAAIEEVLFNKAVVRHGSQVQTLRLKQVSVTTEQYKAIDANMSKCSKWMAGHDKSKKLDIHRPAPNEISADIDTLSTFVKECKKAGEALRKEREIALGPATAEIG